MQAGSDPAPSIFAVAAFRYRSRVLFLEPGSDIYRTDDERVMSFEDTVSFSEALKYVYERSGYILVSVPKTSADDRAVFVRRFVARQM